MKYFRVLIAVLALFVASSLSFDVTVASACPGSEAKCACKKGSKCTCKKGSKCACKKGSKCDCKKGCQRKK